MRAHPAADIFPLLAEAELAELAELAEDLAQCDESGEYARFDTYSLHPDSAWVMADVAPGGSGYWYVTVVERSGVASCMDRPVARAAVPFTLRHLGVEGVSEWNRKKMTTFSKNPWKPDPPEAEEDTRDVYFLQGVHGGPVKIGVAASPAARMATIQLMSPVPLRILAIVPGAGQDLETHLHRFFAHERSHGEWFDPTPELMAWISMNGSAS